jgi:hypothetical protein
MYRRAPPPICVCGVWLYTQVLVCEDCACTCKLLSFISLRKSLFCWCPAADATKRRVLELEEENKRQRAALKARSNEAATAQRQLRELASRVSDAHTAAYTSSPAAHSQHTCRGTPFCHSSVQQWHAGTALADRHHDSSREPLTQCSAQCALLSSCCIVCCGAAVVIAGVSSTQQARAVTQGHNLQGIPLSITQALHSITQNAQPHVS